MTDDNSVFVNIKNNKNLINLSFYFDYDSSDLDDDEAIISFENREKKIISYGGSFNEVVDKTKNILNEV